MKVRRVRAWAMVAATLATTVAGSLVTTTPVHAAADEGAGLGFGANVVSPDLTDKFPCGDASVAALDSFLNFLGAGGQPNYTCHGTLYPTIAGGLPNVAALSGSGVDSTSGVPYSFTGVGNYGGGTYTYSEPCQVSPVDGSKSSNTGEAEGTLTVNLTQGAGFIGATPITSAVIVVDFKWSRVGFNAIIGLENIRLTANGVTIHDTVSKGVATAVFIPESLPDCNNQNHPEAGNINIISGTLSI